MDLTDLTDLTSVMPNYAKLFPAKSAQANTERSLCSVSLRGVQLRAVLVTFGFSENLIVDSAQC